MSPLAKDAGLWTRRERFDSSMDYVPLGERYGALSGLLLHARREAGCRFESDPRRRGIVAKPGLRQLVPDQPHRGSNPFNPIAVIDIGKVSTI